MSKSLELKVYNLSALTENEAKETEGGIFFLIPVLVIAVAAVAGYIAGKSY